MDEKYMQMIIENTQSCKSVHHRIDNIENKVENIYDLTVSVREIATEMKATREEQNKMNDRLKIIEEKPLKDYEETKKQVKMQIVSFFVGIALTATAFIFGINKFI